MTTEHLIEKKDFYESKKAEILSCNSDDEIKAKVDLFRAEKELEILAYEADVKKELESAHADEVKACEHYIEVIDMLIAEATEEDNKKAEEVKAETENETVSNDVVIDTTIL